MKIEEFIKWKGDRVNNIKINNVIQCLSVLPIVANSFVTYMPDVKGYFFNLNLKNSLRLTVTQYEGEYEEGAYVNAILDGKVLVQARLQIEDIVEAVQEFYKMIVNDL